MDQFKRIKTIGKGAFGSAILVSKGGEQYVMKEVPLQGLSAKEKMEAQHEAKVLRKLQHPNIVQYVDSGIQRSKLYIVMEFAAGGDLSDYISKKKKMAKRLSEQQVLGIFHQTCSAIQYVHAQKILHRDLKSQNVFLGKAVSATDIPIVKLGDFGIAKVLMSTRAMAQTQIGTPYYLSPEICDEKPYSYKTDIWSLGCVLYEMMAFRVPFQAADLRGLVKKIVGGRPPALPVQYRSIAGLDEMYQQLLTKNPNRRPSIDDLLEFPVMKKAGAYVPEAALGDGGKKAPNVRSESNVPAAAAVGARNVRGPSRGNRKPDSGASALDRQKVYHWKSAAPRRQLPSSREAQRQKEYEEQKERQREYEAQKKKRQQERLEEQKRQRQERQRRQQELEKQQRQLQEERKRIIAQEREQARREAKDKLQAFRQQAAHHQRKPSSPEIEIFESPRKHNNRPSYDWNNAEPVSYQNGSGGGIQDRLSSSQKLADAAKQQFFDAKEVQNVPHFVRQGSRDRIQSSQPQSGESNVARVRAERQAARDRARKLHEKRLEEARWQNHNSAANGGQRGGLPNIRRDQQQNPNHQYHQQQQRQQQPETDAARDYLERKRAAAMYAQRAKEEIWDTRYEGPGGERQVAAVREQRDRLMQEKHQLHEQQLEQVRRAMVEERRALQQKRQQRMNNKPGHVRFDVNFDERPASGRNVDHAAVVRANRQKKREAEEREHRQRLAEERKRHFDEKMRMQSKLRGDNYSHNPPKAEKKDDDGPALGDTFTIEDLKKGLEQATH